MCFAERDPRVLASFKVLSVRSSFPRIAGVREAWVLLGEAENILAHLEASREKNQASFTQVHLCSQHNLVDEFFDKMENEPEGAQMEAVLAETKEKFIKDALKVMDNHIQEKLPESLKESSPLLQEARQEVRCRIQRRSVSTSLEVQNPEESIWARALRQFLGILQSFLSGCRDALTWLWEKAAACLQAVCSAVEALWEVLKDFCSFVGQLLCRSLIQV
ncbi:PREDICTED: uncharacterized protein LOC104988886 [Bison bison bison]|uniref:Uncharacterized protein LOC104988886 n=1 Tax=Bison bison bison TaxID=43346 RepID=A0A6P3H5B8_BISBB|nr:PREDICTED: uncharacterized protein LOC104988886 [Bison bison bison]